MSDCRVSSLREFKRSCFDWGLSKEVIERASKKCYLPANSIILDEIIRAKDEGKEFKVSFSISGIFVEQVRMYRPEVMESFKRLARTGYVEFLGQTYHHSLASLFDDFDEFREQVKLHRRLMKKEFGVEPQVFENTEFIYNDRIAEEVSRLGFKGMLTEGAERILGWRSPTYLYTSRSGMKLLTRHYRLSDDVGFRFSSRSWDQWPLTADKFASWLSNLQGQYVLLAMDYETFGEHHWPESGIYEFLRYLPTEVLKKGMKFANPSEIVERLQPSGLLEVPPGSTLSWADVDKGVGAWLGNKMQRTAFEEMQKLGPLVKRSRRREAIEVWRLLQISDHFHYMYTGLGGPEEVHQYFSPFKNPLNAFIVYMKALLSFTRVLVGEKVRKRTS
jgi:alpha-amylase